MPRKSKQKKHTITVTVNGKPIAATLHPPTGTRASWYAYWSGLVASRSTGQQQLQEAIVVAEHMMKNGGKPANLNDNLLSDEEFEEIQRSHFGRKTDDQARLRAKKSLDSCMDSIAAFREIMGINPISLATPDDCARFQRIALCLPNRWRCKPIEERRPAEHYSDEARASRQKMGEPDPSDELPRYSPNNVVRWSRSCQAAYERANRNALKRKCVRGVVDESKLLTTNPWHQFTWIEATKRPIRQFDGEELLAVLEFLESEWRCVTAAAAAVKVFLWSGCRKLEVAGLKWADERKVGGEHHFYVQGKRGIERWFRIPDALHEELAVLQIDDSPFVFAVYGDQLRTMHAGNQNWLQNIDDDYSPKRFGRWFYDRIKEWSATNPKGSAYVHIFRKTMLQHTRHGEDLNRQVARDARVSEQVMMTSYVKEADEEMRQRSNRTFFRILAGLSPEVARRYGHVEDARSELERRLGAASDAKDWRLVEQLASSLGRPEAG